MAKLINLRTARKQQKRTAAARQAELNRAKYGQTKAEKLKRSKEQEQEAALLDGAKLSDRE